MSNEIPAAAVYAMVSSKAFQERKCIDAGALSYDVAVTPTAGGVHITTRRALPTTHFPGLLRKFVPSQVTSTERIRCRRVEAFAAPIILAVIDSEEATGHAWAAAIR